LALILAVAFVQAAIGLDQGLPYFPRSDEHQFVKMAAHMAATHHPSPGWFGHPGSTLIYPLAFLYKVWGSIHFRVPLWQTNPDLDALLRIDPGASGSFYTDWAVYYLIGRWLNVAFFVAGIVATYLLGVRTWDKRVALLAAWFMAITPLLVDYAQMIRTDQVGVLFYLIGLLACMRLLSSRRWYDYAWAGVAIGVAGSSRYFDLSLGATLILAHFLAGSHHERGHWNRLVIGLAAIGLGFLITTPAFIFSLEKVRQNLQSEARPPLITLTLAERLWWYLSFALPNALSWPIWPLALMGVLLLRRERNPRAFLMRFGAAVFLLTIILPQLYWQRWIAPLIPISLLFASWVLWKGIDALRDYRLEHAHWRRFITPLLIVAFSAVSLVESVRHVYLVTRPDTRILAAQWLESNVPPGSKIAREWYTPLIPGNFSVTYRRYLFEFGPLDGILAEEYDYVITSSYAYEQFFLAADLQPGVYDQQVRFYDSLSRSEPVAEFAPDSWTTPGPQIEIIRMRGHSP
jgi:hypothetical protein